ncbi:MAG: flagellar hook protein FlgE [Firmicutes bacterium]|nr:flagellar hook protein FlgE [Bacillota bacterium]
MMRSMFAGSSGLRNHQIRMDVVGTNIANVNTIGYKKSRVTFRDALYQSLRGASAPQGNRGGTNPQQVGLGNAVGSIDVVQGAGSAQTTGKMTDLSIQGEGFFILTDGSGRRFYTRAGTFDFDTTGNYVNVTNGFKVMGYMADPATGAIDNSTLTAIDLSGYKSVPPKATSEMKLSGNLDSGTASNDTIVLNKKIYDSQGGEHLINITFTKSATTNQWTASLGASDPAISGITVANPASWTNLVFDSAGKVDLTASGLDTTAGKVTVNIAYTGLGVATPQSITIDMNNLTQYRAESTAWAEYQNGYPQGDLRSISIDITGTILGTYSNGQTQSIAQVALATFQNPSGLFALGDSMFQDSPNSGDADIGTPGSKSRGSILPGTLEMSNVDLSLEFTDMISTQRGFQANARIITASDEMLQELVNLKR